MRTLLYIIYHYQYMSCCVWALNDELKFEKDTKNEHQYGKYVTAEGGFSNGWIEQFTICLWFEDIFVLNIS